MHVQVPSSLSLRLDIWTYSLNNVHLLLISYNYGALLLASFDNSSYHYPLSIEHSPSPPMMTSQRVEPLYMHAVHTAVSVIMISLSYHFAHGLSFWTVWYIMFPEYLHRRAFGYDPGEFLFRLGVADDHRTLLGLFLCGMVCCTS